MLEQKQYHLTLSKSQNVIELRTDLEEGTPCTVCGATHHPWQGEGLIEQGTLIASLKNEVETLSQELQAKQLELRQQSDELIAAQSQLKIETENLDILSARQRKDTDEWQTFAMLDRSFAECSITTNREARTTLIQQLIDKTTVDAEQAEKDLESFTFHLDSIASLGSEIQKKQQHAADLAIQLNEVNTACQVIAREVESLNQHISATTQLFGRQYERLTASITIPDWYRSWRDSHEGLKQRIQTMADEWTTLSAQIEHNQTKSQSLNTACELLRKAITRTQADVLLCESIATRTGDNAKKATTELHKLLDDGDAKGHYTAACQRLAGLAWPGEGSLCSTPPPPAHKAPFLRAVGVQSFHHACCPGTGALRRGAVTFLYGWSRWGMRVSAQMSGGMGGKTRGKRRQLGLGSSQRGLDILGTHV